MPGLVGFFDAMYSVKKQYTLLVKSLRILGVTYKLFDGSPRKKINVMSLASLF